MTMMLAFIALALFLTGIALLLADHHDAERRDRERRTHARRLR